MKPPYRTRAHTIVPFLIGTALTSMSVAVLTLIPFPGRGVTAKDNSLNNIRNLAGAVRAYAIDNDGYLPGWVNNNPRGTAVYAHNTWDEQIRPYISSNRFYYNGSGKGIRSCSQPKYHNRVLSYGLNALLITPPLPSWTGNADFSRVSGTNPPQRFRLNDVAIPTETILLAELSTRYAMSGVYGRTPEPVPFTFTGNRSSPQWREALSEWIDISPRAFVECGTPVMNCYYPYWSSGCTDKGIARDLYGGGGCYAFCDGHVEFMPIRDSVGLGKKVRTTVIQVYNCWASANVHNRWNPYFPRGK